MPKFSRITESITTHFIYVNKSFKNLSLDEDINIRKNNHVHA